MGDLQFAAFCFKSEHAVNYGEIIKIRQRVGTKLVAFQPKYNHDFEEDEFYWIMWACQLAICQQEGNHSHWKRIKILELGGKFIYLFRNFKKLLYFEIYDKKCMHLLF